MRESNTFAERTRVFSSDKTVKKFFLVYEGSDTEVIYFDMVNIMREEIGISPIIELVPILRSYSEEGWSNPKKILDRVIENLEENKSGHISYETLLNRLMSYFYEKKIITTSKVQARSIWRTMCKYCEEVLMKSLTSDVEHAENVCGLILAALQEEYKLEHVVSDISNIIKESDIRRRKKERESSQVSREKKEKGNYQTGRERKQGNPLLSRHIREAEVFRLPGMNFIIDHYK